MTEGEQEATQLPSYETAFGLQDNPFRPRAFANVDEGLLNDISGDPLALDKQPELLPLFVAGAGPFQKGIDHFEWLLGRHGYLHTSDRPMRPRSMALRVIGPEGSGKSTLTNHLIKQLKESAGSDLLLIRRSVKGDAAATIDQVRSRLNEYSAARCCIVFDDVRLDIEEQLHDLYEDLRQPSEADREAAVVMFEVIHYGQDIKAPRPSSRVEIENLRTAWLTPDHAVAFLESRIALFRSQSAAAKLTGDLGLFPFDAADIRSVVTHNGAQEQTLTLRTLNRILSRGLDLELMNRGAERDLASLSQDDLRQHTISACEVYEREILDQIGAYA